MEQCGDTGALLDGSWHCHPGGACTKAGQLQQAGRQQGAVSNAPPALHLHAAHKGTILQQTSQCRTHCPGHRVGCGEALGHEVHANVRVFGDHKVLSHALGCARLGLRRVCAEQAGTWSMDGMNGHSCNTCAQRKHMHCVQHPICKFGKLISPPLLQLTPLPAALRAACRRARAASTSAAGIIASTAGGIEGGTGQVCTAPKRSSSSIAPCRKSGDRELVPSSSGACVARWGAPVAVAALPAVAGVL